MYVCVEDSQTVLSTAKHQKVFFFFFTSICLFLVNESPRLKSHCQSALFLPSLYLYYVCFFFFFFFSVLLIGSFLPLLDELHMAYAP